MSCVKTPVAPNALSSPSASSAIGTSAKKTWNEIALAYVRMSFSLYRRRISCHAARSDNARASLTRHVIIPSRSLRVPPAAIVPMQGPYPEQVEARHRRGYPARTGTSLGASGRTTQLDGELPDAGNAASRALAISLDLAA